MRRALVSSLLLRKTQPCLILFAPPFRSHIVVNQLFSNTSKANEQLLKTLSRRGWDVSRLYLGFSNWKYECDLGHEHED